MSLMDRITSKPRQDPKKEEKERKRNILKNKFGFEDNRVNRNLEQTHQYIYSLMKRLFITGIELKAMKEYMLDKIEFEDRWRKGEISHWKQFYMATDEMRERYEREKIEEWQSLEKKITSPKDVSSLLRKWLGEH